MKKRYRIAWRNGFPGAVERAIRRTVMVTGDYIHRRGAFNKHTRPKATLNDLWSMVKLNILHELA